VNAKYFIGSGKVEEIVALVKETSLELVIFSSELA
jgi:50S ribosomal subunit-associated GTPase HflX